MLFSNSKFGEVVRSIIKSLFFDETEGSLTPPPGDYIRITTDSIRVTEDNSIRILVD